MYGILKRYLLLVSLFQFGLSNDAEFNSQPKQEPYYVKTNDVNLTLPCSVSDNYSKEPFVLNWIKIINGSPRIITTSTMNRMTDLYDLDTTSCNGCYNLRIQKITYEQDNAKFFCQITGSNNFVKESQPANVIVLVKPGDAKITAQPLQSVREGGVISVECRSVGGNPPPRIQWFFNNGTEITGQVVKQTNATDVSSPTVGILQMIVTPNENTARITCKLWNEALGEDVQVLEAITNPLSVLYAPRVSIGPTTPYNVEVGSTATLYCSANGNPPPNRFTWTLNGNPQPVGAGGQNLTFIVTKAHGGRYSCVAASEDTTGHEELQLNVLYAPEITLNNEYRGVVGQSATLLCNVDANPPATNVGWLGPNGHSSETNILEITSVTLKDMGNYTCTAKNSLNLYSNGSVTRSETKSTMLVVDHKPTKGVISTTEPVIVGSTANLTCKAEDLGSPAAEYKWKTPGQAVFDVNPRQILTIADVRMTHAGEYSCLPFNSIGDGDPGTYNLVVYEPARLDQVLYINESKNEGDPTFSLSCSAKGYPPPNITWYKDNELLEEPSHWSMNQHQDVDQCDVPGQCLLKVLSSLDWKSPVRWSDKGVYVCQAFNGAGVPARSNATLKVSHKPVIINDPDRPFVASDVGQSAQIECKANARPEPTFRWYKDGQDITTTESSTTYSFAQQRVSESDDVFENTLTIRKVQEQDMGEYVCKATNSMGDHKFIFTLQLKTKPMMPTDVRVVGHSYRSITLGWTPGFDGGESQTFSIEIVYPDNTLHYANTTDVTKFGRYKRFVGIEKAVPITLNNSELTPNSEYKFRVKAMNRLGETEWTGPVTYWTDDAPLDSTIKTPTYGVYNTDTMVLDFKPTTMDPQIYCLLVYRQQSSGKYAVQGCFPLTDKIENLKPANNFKIRFCSSQTYVCGGEYEVMTGVQNTITTPIIIAIVASAVFILIVATIVCLYCYRTRRSKDKTKNISSSTIGRASSTGVGTQRKDYEMETNQVRPNIYQTDKIITGSTLDQQKTGGSSKDSGIFTTESFQYDNRARYPVQDAATGVDGGAGMMLNRTPSYDDQEHWGATDGYGLTNSYLNAGGPSEYGGSLSKGEGLTSPYYDSYAVDMNPAGGVNNDASSLHSGYSTPSGRRVMREIIV